MPEQDYRWRQGLVTLLCGITLTAGAAGDDWVLKRDRDGIRVYTRDIADSPYDAVRAEGILKGELLSAIAIVRDVDACAEWAALCKLSSELEVVSPLELYVYTHNDIPWPVSDRDAVTHVLWEQDPGNYTISMRASVVGGKMPEKKGVVRIAKGITSWDFIPQDDGTVQAVMEAHVDPSGPTPAWLTNMLLVDAPFDTLQGLRRLLQSGRYDNAKLEFFSAPPANRTPEPTQDSSTEQTSAPTTGQ